MDKIEIGIPLGYNLYYTFNTAANTEAAVSPFF